MEAILSVKAKSAIKKHAENAGINVEFFLKNISINGDKRGCSGFVRNTENGSIVYLDTEPSCGFIPPLIYRYADSVKDYRGYRDRFVDTLDDLARSVVDMLKKTPKEIGDIR